MPPEPYEGFYGDCWAVILSLLSGILIGYAIWH